MKPQRHKKRWTMEEIEYLEDNWGFVTLETLVRNLQRTESGIFGQVRRLGLGKSQYAGGLFYTPNQLADILRKCHKEIYQLCEIGEIKVRKKRLIKERAYQISLDSILEFLRDNPDKWDSRNVEEYAFGIEPDWMKEKRKKDLEIPKHHRRWTREEENQLIRYANLGYEMKYIADIFGRTIHAIYRRTQELREQGRLKPTKRMKYWDDKEINLMLQLEKEGLEDVEIAKTLNRKAFHITDKRRTLREQGKYEGYKGRNINVYN